MRKALLFGTIVSALMLVPLCANAGFVQALPNAGFDNGTASPWSHGSFGGSGDGITTKIHRKGKAAWELTVGQSPNGVMQYNVAMGPTKIYYQSAWVYLTNIPDPTVGVRVTLSSCFWKDSAGNNKITPTVDLYVKKANTWTEIVDNTGYSGCYKMEYFSVSIYSGANRAYVDDCDLLTTNLAVTPEPASIIGLGVGMSSVIGYAMKRRRC